MFRIPAVIRNAIVNGYVLDDNGAWVPINVMLGKERDFAGRLESGEVLVDDCWVSIAEAKRRERSIREGRAPTPPNVTWPEAHR